MTPRNAADQSGKIARAHRRSTWLLEIAPRVPDLPAPIQKYDDPFLPYCRAVVSATGNFVAGYVFDLAAFLALGAAGAIALERAVAVIAATPDTLSVIHGPFARAEFAAFVGETALRADAATVTDGDIADRFAGQGVIGLPMVAEPDGGRDAANLEAGWLRLAGEAFRMARQGFLDQYRRDDFETALRRAAGLEFGQ